VYLCVLCEYKNKQRLLPYTALTGGFYSKDSLQIESLKTNQVNLGFEGLLDPHIKDLDLKMKVHIKITPAFMYKTTQPYKNVSD
jgi:hypothetical protein